MEVLLPKANRVEGVRVKSVYACTWSAGKCRVSYVGLCNIGDGHVPNQ